LQTESKLYGISDESMFPLKGENSIVHIFLHRFAAIINYSTELTVRHVACLLQTSGAKDFKV